MKVLSEGCLKNSGMEVDGLKSTSDIALMLSFGEDGREEGEESRLGLRGKRLKEGSKCHLPVRAWVQHCHLM